MRDEPVWGLLATTVLSHLSMIPVVRLLVNRSYICETCIAAFGLTSSILYHICQAFDTVIFLDELCWHRLDNIGVIAGMGMWFVFICTFRDPVVERSVKYFTFFVSIISQEKDPWNIAYTVGPVILFACIPAVVFLRTRRIPAVDHRFLIRSALFMGIGIPFFVAGLDDENDPYRIYHGLWHFFGGIASYYMWLMVKNPGATGVYPKHASIVVRGDTLL